MNIKKVKDLLKKGAFAALITLGIGVPSFASTSIQYSPGYEHNNTIVEKGTMNLKGVEYEIQKTLNKFVDLGKTEKIIENIELDTLPYVEALKIKVDVYLKAIKEGKITTKQARDMLHKDPYFQHVQKNLKLLIEIQHYLNEKTKQIINYDLEHKKDYGITEQELDIIRHVKDNLIQFFDRNGELLQNLVQIANDQLMREGTEYAIKNNLDEYDYDTYYNKNDIKGLGL